MKQQLTRRHGRKRAGRPFGLGLVAAAALLLLLVVPAEAQVIYAIWGRAQVERVAADPGDSSATLAIPDVVVPDPATVTDPDDAAFDPIHLPGVTIEVFRVSDGVRLGTGRSDRDGWYNVTYVAEAGGHDVRFTVYLDYKDVATGADKREIVGRVDKTPSGDPITNAGILNFDLDVPSDSFIGGGFPVVSPIAEFVFTEVGDIDVDDICDQQADSVNPACGAANWGLTKASTLVGAPPGTAIGTGLAFGHSLELYGLFSDVNPPGPARPARYYKINYAGPVSGSLSAPLWKKNFVLVGSSVEVYRTKLGPMDVAVADFPVGCPPGGVALTGAYQLDDRLAGEPIPGVPGRFYSNFWTELGLRGWWKTASGPDSVAGSDGKYVLSVETWDECGLSLSATNDYANIDLHVVNTKPESIIHQIEHQTSGLPVLTDAAPCQTVHLEPGGDPADDSLQFEITARHPDGFLKSWDLRGWFGHDTPISPGNSLIESRTTPVVTTDIHTPATITYQSCAYRFRLRTVPRITNGYHIIYRRYDNWYACIDVTP